MVSSNFSSQGVLINRPCLTKYSQHCEINRSIVSTITHPYSWDASTEQTQLYSWHWLRRWENGSTEERNYLIIRIPGENQRAVGVSEWFLLKGNSAIFQLYHGENKLIFNEMMIKFALFQTNKLGWFVIALVHCNNCLRVDMSLHSDTLIWFRANQSLFLLLHAAWLAEKQQIPI